MKNNIFFIAIILGGIIIFSSFQTFAFYSRNIFISKFSIDTTIPVQTVRGKLGTTGYYIQKPTDCIEDLSNDQNVQKSYSIYPRDTKERYFHGSCIITWVQSYYQRKNNLQKNERIFTDTILGKVITIKEYLRDNMICREGEIVTDEDFLFFFCDGTDNWELRKYYNVAKSLSK